jgi:glutaminase
MAGFLHVDPARLTQVFATAHKLHFRGCYESQPHASVQYYMSLCCVRVRCCTSHMILCSRFLWLQIVCLAKVRLFRHWSDA